MDSNGYNESILETDSEHDFITKKESLDTVRHEVYFGPLRPVSKHLGLWVYLSPKSHRLIHSGATVDGISLDRMLKMQCQRVYERTHSRDEFMKIIGRSYL